MRKLRLKSFKWLIQDPTVAELGFLHIEPKIWVRSSRVLKREVLLNVRVVLLD